MGLFILLILIVIIVAVAVSGSSGKGSYVGSYQNGPVRNYDDDFENYETCAVRGERDFFTNDSARDYDSYYAQVADEADMGDQDAIEEMNSEFGEWEW